MPELFALRPSVKNRNNYNLRQSSRLLARNQSYKQKTDVYYVPENNDAAPIHNTQRNQSSTPYNLSRTGNYNKPIPRKKVFYRPLRVELQPFEQPYEPPPPPVRKTSIFETAPVRKSSILKPVPVRKTSILKPAPVRKISILEIEPVRESSILESEPVRKSSPLRSLPVRKVYRPPPSPMITTNSSSGGVVEMFHLNVEDVDDESIQSEPQPVRRRYRTPSPSPPVRKSRPSRAVLGELPPSPTPVIAQFYHLQVEKIDDEPEPIERPPRSPSPLPPPVRKPPPPPVIILPPPPPVIIPPPPPPPPVFPELYHLKFQEFEREPIQPEPEPVEPPHKSPTPPPASPVNIIPTPPPVINIPVSPIPSEKSYKEEPEVHHLPQPINYTSRSPLPLPPSPQPPSPIMHRTGPPLALPVRKHVPVPVPVVINDVPYRRPSFFTSLHDVITGHRPVDLSASKASDSILRSMSKFRYDRS